MLMKSYTHRTLALIDQPCTILMVSRKDVVWDCAVGRKRGGLIEAIAQLYYSGKRGYIVIVERGTATGLRQISLESIEKLKRGYIVLVDGTIIPLHRIVMVLDERGDTVYARSADKGTKHSKQ